MTFQWKPNNELPETFDAYQETNEKDTTTVIHGMIAQEVKAALDSAGVSTFNGWKEAADGVQGLSAEAFVFPLIKAVQELSAKVKELEK